LDLSSQEILTDYYCGMPMDSITAKHGICSSRVYKIRQKWHLKCRPRRKYSQKRKWGFNLDFFRNPDEISAYWLGFIFADGCLSKNKYSYSLTISLHEKDRKFLQKFARDIGLSSDAVRKDEKRKKARLRISHAKLLGCLSSFSIIPNKTYVFHPSRIEVALIPPFLRGWIDGDGYWKKDNKGGAIRITSNKEAVL